MQLQIKFDFDDSKPIDEHALAKQLEYLCDDVRNAIELHMKAKHEVAQKPR